MSLAVHGVPDLWWQSPDRPFTTRGVGPPSDHQNSCNRCFLVVTRQFWGDAAAAPTSILWVSSPPQFLGRRDRHEKCGMRKQRGPYKTHLVPHAMWMQTGGHNMCPPVCMHTSTCMAWTAAVHAVQVLPLLFPLLCLFHMHRPENIKELPADRRKTWQAIPTWIWWCGSGAVPLPHRQTHNKAQCLHFVAALGTKIILLQGLHVKDLQMLSVNSNKKIKWGEYEWASNLNFHNWSSSSHPFLESWGQAVYMTGQPWCGHHAKTEGLPKSMTQ